MDVLTIQNALMEDSRSIQKESSYPVSTRKYTRGQKVKVKICNGDWMNGQVVDFGNQDCLPLYWVKIEGCSQEVFKFEFELGLKDDD